MMHFEPLISPDDLLQELPISECQSEFVQFSRNQIKKILNGDDSRLLLVIGPCSIHDTIAAREYAIKLKQLAEEVSASFFIVMRTHFEKPRTTVGWKGLLYDPHLDGSCDIQAGLRSSRRFLLELADLEVPSATEFLDPSVPYYYGDLVSLGSIGARTVSSQIHRQLVSGFPIPFGFKNDTNGDLSTAVNAVITAVAPHHFMGIGKSGKAGIVHTSGNPDVHIVLRGGDKQPNYDAASIQYALELLLKANLPQRLLIDCSHDNSSKNHENQPGVFQSALHQMLEGNRAIKGMILESFLEAGSQTLPHQPALLKYAISLTDPCIDWNTTQQLITWAHQKITREKESQKNPSLCYHVPQYIQQ